jgi:hypothetical protein
MNQQDEKSHSTAEFHNHDVSDSSLPQSAPHEINNDEIETIVSAALPYTADRHGDSSSIFYDGNENAQDSAARTETLESISRASDNLEVSSEAPTAPIIDEYVLAELRDAGEGFVGATSSSSEPASSTLAGARKRKSRNSGSDSEETISNAKKSKMVPARDPNAVSKVVSWEIW